VPQLPPASSAAAGALYRVVLTPADVGARVVVRRRLPAAPPGEPPLGDVLGDLVSWADGTLVVRTRSGDLVEVAEDTVVAAKRVPPPRARRSQP
jgi:hypothetical protein